jgi:hypothetical protein
VRSLSNTQLLLALCLHGTKHFWSSLGWLVDLAELMRRDTGIDSQWVRVQARANGCERRVGLGLRMAKDLLDAPVPDLLAPLTGDATVRDRGAADRREPVHRNSPRRPLQRRCA